MLMKPNLHQWEGVFTKSLELAGDPNDMGRRVRNLKQNAKGI